MDNEIYVIPFKFKYLQQLIEIHKLRDNALNTELTMKDLPKIGVLAFLGKSLVAAGFLRRVEPNYAQLDTFLSNPFFGSLIRHEAMTKVVDSLLEEAKDLDLKMLIAHTKDPSIIKRATDLGFVVSDQIIIAKVLK